VTRDRTIKVRIVGIVQGVGFRAWTEQRANALGLSGWVKGRATTPLRLSWRTRRGCSTLHPSWIVVSVIVWLWRSQYPEA